MPERVDYSSDQEFEYACDMEAYHEQQAKEQYEINNYSQFENMIKCTFTSVWDDGSEVTTGCQYNPNTGLCEPEVSPNEPPTGSLEREYITLEDGKELDVCPECHGYLLKTTVEDRADLSYGEVTRCMNEDCDG